MKKPKTAITPEQFEALLAEIPDAFRLMVLVAIETGVRWGGLAALRSVDIDFGSHVITVQRVVLEVARKVTGSESGFVFRDYPKDNEHRDVMVGAELCRAIREHMLANGMRDDDLLFSTSLGTPISRNTFRTRVWLPAIERSGLRQRVRFHDLRGAHASWLLAGGADLKVVMDRLGHRQNHHHPAIPRQPPLRRRASTEGLRGHSGTAAVGHWPSLWLRKTTQKLPPRSSSTGPLADSHDRGTARHRGRRAPAACRGRGCSRR